MRDFSADWIDVTYPIFENMVSWPGQPEVAITRQDDMSCGDDANVSILRFSAHTGTHMDAPCHFLAQQEDITSAPLSVLMGTVRVADLDGATAITDTAIEAYEKRTRRLAKDERIIFRTANSERNWPADAEFDKGYAAVMPAAAELLVDRQVSFVGVDYLSVAPFADPATTHRLLLHQRIWIVEGIDLRQIAEGDYEMICLPLKIKTSDASPVRILLRPVE